MREKTFLVPKLPQAYSRPQSLSFLGHEASYKLCRVALGTRIPQAQHNPRIMLGLYHSLREIKRVVCKYTAEKMQPVSYNITLLVYSTLVNGAFYAP